MNKIKKGFKVLKSFCSSACLVGFVKKEDIPDIALKDTDIIGFSHYYNNTTIGYYDDCDFHGSIYLPYYNGEYMEFNVSA